MGTFLLGIVVVLGPSVAVVAWLIWSSGLVESPRGGRQNEPWIGS